MVRRLSKSILPSRIALALFSRTREGVVLAGPFGKVTCVEGNFAERRDGGWMERWPLMMSKEISRKNLTSEPLCLSVGSHSRLVLINTAILALLLLVAQFAMVVLSRMSIKSRKGCAEEDTIPSNREAKQILEPWALSDESHNIMDHSPSNWFLWLD